LQQGPQCPPPPPVSPSQVQVVNVVAVVADPDLSPRDCPAHPGRHATHCIISWCVAWRKT
jgi:hypothetical protein